MLMKNQWPNICCDMKEAKSRDENEVCVIHSRNERWYRKDPFQIRKSFKKLRNENEVFVIHSRNEYWKFEIIKIHSKLGNHSRKQCLKW